MPLLPLPDDLGPSPDALADQPLSPRESLAEEIATAMSAAWELGQRPRSEDYFFSHPEVKEHPVAATRVIYEELCLRERIGQGPGLDELIGRFPTWADELRMLMDCHQMVRRDTPRHAGFPDVGESLGDFTARAVLGEGSRGRVYLATQRSLGDRPVVLKVTPRKGDEHLSLAMLQHPHVVPLFACQEFPERDLRAICMPYLGGATLDRVIERRREPRGSCPSGATFLEVLDQARTEYLRLPAWSATRQFLARATYPRAVCWLGACIAEALHYAHSRGLVHLDLKPSNILIADDGQPMLLDFHLARGPLAAGDRPPGHLGGTPGYASPEQERAMDSVSDGGAVPDPIDGRSDLYSLGAVLFEALAGALPELEAGPPVGVLLRGGHGTPLGLAEMVGRCLSERPSDRYQDAASLGADLRRHLGNLPPRGVPRRLSPTRWIAEWRASREGPPRDDGLSPTR